MQRRQALRRTCSSVHTIGALADLPGSLARALELGSSRHSWLSELFGPPLLAHATLGALAHSWR